MLNIISRGTVKEGGLTGGLNRGGLTRGGLTIPYLSKMRSLTAYLIIMLLVACGDSSNRPRVQQPPAPPPAPAQPQYFSGTGTAALGLVSDAAITAYAITDEARSCAHNSLRVIGSGQSDGDGHYNMTILMTSPDDFMLLRLTGGSYIEEASGVEVYLSPGQSLYAIGAIPAQGTSEHKPIIISPISSIQAGMFCHLIEKTDSPLAAAAEATVAFATSYIGFDPRYVAYKDPTAIESNHGSTPLDNGHLLGLLNAGISQYSYDLSVRAEGQNYAHNYINSVYVSQYFFDDIYEDGMLNGKGLAGNLLIGPRNYVEPLTLSSYMLDLPESVLKFYDDNSRNEIRKDRSFVYKMADQMNSVTGSMALSGEVLALDREAPRVIWLSSNKISGTNNITLQVTDLTSVADVTLLGNEDIDITNTHGNSYSFVLDSAVYNSGEHQLDFVATDTLGNQATITFDIVVINDAPSIKLTSPNSSKQSNYKLSFTISKAHQQQQIDYSNSSCRVSSSQSIAPTDYAIRNAVDGLACDVELHQGINNIQVTLCDDNSLCSRGSSYSVKYDKTPPKITAIDLDSSYRGNVSFRVEVTDALSSVNDLPQYSVMGNGQSLTGTTQQLNTTEYLIYFDATRFGNGNIDIQVTAADTESNEATALFTTLVVNQPATASLTSAVTFNSQYTPFTFSINENSYSDIKITCRISEHSAIIPAQYSPVEHSASCSIFTLTMPDGEAELQLSICGEYGLCNLETFTIIKDTTVPLIRFIDLEDSYEISGASITLRIEDAHLDEEYLKYQIDGGEQRSLIEQGDEWILYLPASLATGRHLLVITARDTLGNSAEITQEFLLLLDEPAVTLASRLLTKYDAYTLTAMIDPKSYIGDYSATCTLGDTEVVALIRNNLITCNINLVDAADGEHDVDILLTTDYGRDYNRQLQITKDTSPPNIRFIDLEDSYEISSASITLSITDDNLNEASLKYQIDEQEQLPLIKQGDKWILTLPSDLATGRHQLSVAASDSLGSSATLTEEFLLLLDEPAISLTSTALTKDDAYTLVARIDPKTYTGDYSATCTLAGTEIEAHIRNNLLTCSINLVTARDGVHNVDIVLTADYGIDYNHRLQVTKDTNQPRIRFSDLRSNYGQTGEAVTLTIDDYNLDEKSLKYQINNQVPKRLIKQGDTWIFYLPASLTTGRHDLTITASDALGQAAEITGGFLLLLDEPAITLTSRPLTKNDAYTLTARIDPKTYTGDYTASCSLNRVVIGANIRNNLLTCNINLVEARDGAHNLDILLTSNYGREYRRRLQITKDVTPPNISCPFRDGYDASIFTTACVLSDEHSAVVSFSYRDPLNNNRVIEVSPPYIITINPSAYADGDYAIEVTATDEAGNTAEASYSFSIDKTPPSLSLPSRIHTRQDRVDIQGTYQESELVEIRCIRNDIGQDLDIIATLQNDNSFLCKGYLVTNMNLEDRVEVRACDIYDNCKSHYIHVLHDTRAPTGNVEAGDSYYKLALPGDRTPNIINPSVFALNRDKTFINASDVKINYLRNNNYAFVSWQGADSSAKIPHPLLQGLDKQLYVSNPSNLTYRYSYSQRTCGQDNPGNIYSHHCPESKINYYFHNKKLTGQITEGSMARVIIPLTDEYLSAEGKHLWYLAPVANTIHRIDLYVCDEADNCRQYIARFRVNLLASGPVITDLDIPETSKNLLKDINSFINANHNSPIVTRVFEISNPSQHPVFFTIHENQAVTKLKILRRKYKRINGYYRKTVTVTYLRRVREGNSFSPYRCIYQRTTTSGPTIEIFSDTFPRNDPGVSTLAFAYGSCSNGGRSSTSHAVAGYPKNVDADYKSSGAATGSYDRTMQYHSVLDENNAPYHPDSYHKLEPGETKRVRFRETLPNYSGYRDNNLPLPGSYTASLGYNWKAVSYSHNKLNIKFGRADSSGLLEIGSVITYQKKVGPTSEITTDGRFTTLPGTPR